MKLEIAVKGPDHATNEAVAAAIAEMMLEATFGHVSTHISSDALDRIGDAIEQVSAYAGRVAEVHIVTSTERA